MLTAAMGGLWRAYVAYYGHGRPILKWAGIVGAIGFPVFYLLNVLRKTHTYDHFGLRMLGGFLLLVLALRDYWPKPLRRYYLPWSYVSLLYCLPFFFILMSLKNGGGSVSVANTFMAVFFLILLTDWRNTIVMLVLGAALAALCYVVFTQHPMMPKDYLERLPPLILVVIGGSTFKFSQQQIEEERLDAAKALAGSIAHEMRNPLGQIKHSLESLRQSLPSPTTTEQRQVLNHEEVNSLYRHLAQGDIAVQRGLQVISMTLDEVSAKPLNPVGFAYLAAADECNRAVLEYGYDSPEQRARVDVAIKRDFLFRGEETAFLFVLFNLLKNALYYLPAYPDARVTITVDDGTIKVRDTGPGISAELQGRLFEPFRSSKSGGTGLGLAYCRRVMRAFGGEIACESIVGEFTEFTLAFPPVTEQEREAYRKSVVDKARAVFVRRRLLLVDDDAGIRKATRAKLSALDAVIDEASDGKQALAMLSNFRYDLVLLDLAMPGMDGYAAAEQIRAGVVPSNRDVCIVAHTSEPGLLARVKILKAGMDGLINKPCEQDALLQALCRALENPAGRARLERSDLAGLKVLVADDNSYNRKAVAAFLRRARVEVEEADTGIDVMKRLENSPIAWDAILLDLNMPGMSGLETAKAIRLSPQSWRATPLVALTAHSTNDMVAKARDAGMDEFLTKPVDAAVLYETLRQLRSKRPFVAAMPKDRSQATVDSLLDPERLERYREIGMLEELVGDYVPEIERLVAQLQEADLRHELHECTERLHSLVGLSGEAGAAVLHRACKEVYVRVLQDGQAPAAGWSAEIAALASQSMRALEQYVHTGMGAA